LTKTSGHDIIEISPRPGGPRGRQKNRGGNGNMTKSAHFRGGYLTP